MKNWLCTGPKGDFHVEAKTWEDAASILAPGETVLGESVGKFADKASAFKVKK